MSVIDHQIVQRMTEQSIGISKPAPQRFPLCSPRVGITTKKASKEANFKYVVVRTGIDFLTVLNQKKQIRGRKPTFTDFIVKVGYLWLTYGFPRVSPYYF
jgi:hypothetical protein